MNQQKLKKLILVSIAVLFILSPVAADSWDLTPNYAAEGDSIDIMKFEVNNTSVNAEIANITVEYTGNADLNDLSEVKVNDTKGMSPAFEENVESVKFNISTGIPVEEARNITVLTNISDDASSNGAKIDLNITDIYGGVKFINENYADPEGNTTLDTKPPNITSRHPDSNGYYRGDLWINGTAKDLYSVEYSAYEVLDAEQNLVASGDLNDTFDTSSVSYGNYLINHSFEDGFEHANSSSTWIRMGKVAWDLTPRYEKEGENISVMKFRVDSEGVNSTLRNITVGYNGTAGVGNLTHVKALNETGNASWIETNLSQEFNVTVNESVTGVENITLGLWISPNATANGETVDLNVTGVYGTNVTLPENYADPDGNTTLDTKQPVIESLTDPEKYANISSYLEPDAEYSDDISGVKRARWFLAKGDGFIYHLDGTIIGNDLGDGDSVYNAEDDTGYEIHYEVKDRVGHTTLDVRYITIDNTLPEIEWSFIKDGGYYRDTIPVNVTWSDNLVGVMGGEYNITNSTGNRSLKNGDLNGTFNTTKHDFGEYFVNFTVMDYAFNELEVQKKFYIDNDPPNFTVFSPAGLNESYDLDGIYASSEIDIEATASDPPANLSNSMNISYWKLKNESGVQKEESLNSGFPNYSISTENYQDGNYTILYNVTDKAGHYRDEVRKIIIDTSRPIATIHEPNISMIDEGFFAISASWSDNTTGVRSASYEIVNSSDIVPEGFSGSLNDTVNASALPTDTYKINYLIADLANNGYMENKQIIVDHLPPNVSNVEPVENANVSDIFSIDAFYEDPYSGMNYTWYNLSNSTFNMTGGIPDTVNSTELENGYYNVTMQFVDNLDNIKEINRTIRVDNTHPEVWNLSINATPPIPPGGTFFSATAYANDTVTGVEECALRLNSRRENLEFAMDYYPGEEKLNTTFSLAGKEGLYNITAECTDYAGNKGGDTVMNYSNNSNGSMFFFDNRSPHLENIDPQGFLGSEDPVVEADIRDLSGVNNSSVKMWFNGSNVSEFNMVEFENRANNSQYRINYTPENITEGELYWVNFSAEDSNNFTSYNDSLAWNFTVDLTPPRTGNFSLPVYSNSTDVFLNWTEGSDKISGIAYYRVLVDGEPAVEGDDGADDTDDGTDGDDGTDDGTDGDDGTDDDSEDGDEDIDKLQKTNFTASMEPGNHTVAIEYVDRAGNINETTDHITVDIDAPALESATRDIFFESPDSVGERTISFVATDTTGIKVDDLNFTFGDRVIEYNPSENYTDFNLSYNGSYPERVEGNYTTTLAANNSYLVSLEISDRFRSEKHEWWVDSAYESEEPATNETTGGGFTPSSNFTFENETLVNESEDLTQEVDFEIPDMLEISNSSASFNLGITNNLNRSISMRIDIVSSYLRTDVPGRVTLDPGGTLRIPVEVSASGVTPGNYSAGMVFRAEGFTIRKILHYEIVEGETPEFDRIELENRLENLNKTYREMLEEGATGEEVDEIRDLIRSSSEALEENSFEEASQRLSEAESRIEGLKNKEEAFSPWLMGGIVVVTLIMFSGLILYFSRGRSFFE